MKNNKLWFLLVFLFSSPLLAQYGAINGYCNLGATQIIHQGLKSSNYAQGIVPSCTVTVYLTGTSNLATIYSNSSQTPLSNPFTASPQGKWNFYTLNSQGYDIVLSGGVYPNQYLFPVTLADEVVPASVNGSGVISFPFPITSPEINQYIFLNNTSDIGAQINAAVAALGGESGQGVIVLPLGTSNMSTTATINSAGISLIGYGPTATRVNCTTTGDCLVVDCSSITCHDETQGAAAEYTGFWLAGSGGALQNIMHTKDIIGFNIHDIELDGASASGQSCMLLEDHSYYTERNKIDHVDFGYNCNYGMYFYPNTTTDPFCPSSLPTQTCSYGYNDIQVSMNPTAGQVGIVMAGNGILYNGTLTVTQNLAGTQANPATGILGAGYFAVTRELLDLRSEENGAATCTGNNAGTSYCDIAWNMAGLTNSWQFGGHAYTDQMPNVFAGGIYGNPLTITEGGWGTDYTQETYATQGGIPYDFTAGGQYIIPIYANSGYYGGIGLSGRFQYSSGNFLCIGDGAHNGCGFMLLTKADGITRFYNVPDTGGANQIIPAGTENTYQTMTISPGGTINVTNLTGTAVTGTTVNGTTSTSGGKVIASNGTFSAPTAVNVTALSTPTLLTGSGVGEGLLVLHDATSGGMALFLLDPNFNAQLIGTSNITGCSTSACMTFSGGNWYITLTSGSGARTLNWAIYAN